MQVFKMSQKTSSNISSNCHRETAISIKVITLKIFSIFIIYLILITHTRSNHFNSKQPKDLNIGDTGKPGYSETKKKIVFEIFSES